jgi:hypothetical protein
MSARHVRGECRARFREGPGLEVAEAMPEGQFVRGHGINFGIGQNRGEQVDGCRVQELHSKPGGDPEARARRTVSASSGVA